MHLETVGNGKNVYKVMEKKRHVQNDAKSDEILF